MAMFPPAMPRAFIAWLTNEGDPVLDPFSGRGTTALEASLAGRVPLASDLNPLAVLLTRSKVDVPQENSVLRRLSELKATYRVPSVEGTRPEISALFSHRTLRQLVWLRTALNLEGRVDRFIMAVTLGILHANANKDGTARGLSVPMPNTFSMAPGYIARYVDQNGLVPPDVDVFDSLIRRTAHLYRRGAPPRMGSVWSRDAASQEYRPGPRRNSVKLVFTSPPYLHVIRYGKFNWLRLWQLGISGGDVDRALFTSSSPDKYIMFMSDALRSIDRALTEDGIACLVIGDVDRRAGPMNLAELVAERCLGGTELSVLDQIVDDLPTDSKVSRIWGDRRGDATRTDRVLILGKPGVRLPAVASS
jgi:site-specific DNA-methyltransferase (adenine-specific)